jgi:pimeloyl-ACP methyl ester carboxylesterase
MDRRCTMGDALAPYEMEREFEDVVAVAAALGDEVDILGHSSGALCALGASLQTPNLRRLMLYEPPLETDPRLPPIVEELYTLLKAGDIDGVLDCWLKDYVGIPEEIAEGLKASAVGADLRPWAQYLPREMAAHIAYEWNPAIYEDLTAPTLYLAGEQTTGDDQLRGFVPLLQEVVPSFRLREIPGQGHLANFFAPELLASIVLEFVESETPEAVK